MARGPMKQTTRKVHFECSKNYRTHHLSLTKYASITIQSWQNILVWDDGTKTKDEPKCHHNCLPHKFLLYHKGKCLVMPWRWGSMQHSIMAFWYNGSHVKSQNDWQGPDFLLLVKQTSHKYQSYWERCHPLDDRKCDAHTSWFQIYQCLALVNILQNINNNLLFEHGSMFCRNYYSSFCYIHNV